MVDDADQNAEHEWLKNLPIRSEEIGFAPGDLVTCPNCGRTNAPNRATCLYCGALPAGVFPGEKLELRAIEPWENGFNVVLLDPAGADLEKAAGLIAQLVSGERELFKTAFETGKQIPVVRLESEGQARRVRESLSQLGIEAAIVEDAELQASSPPVRLRSIGFEGEQLNIGLFNIDEVHTISADELALVVAGTMIEGRRESLKRKKLRGSKMLDESATSSDEPVIDLYSSNDPRGWRIPARGFDFSCLGAEKSFVVGENMKKLIAKLVEFAPGVHLVDDYSSVRPFIEATWPSEVKREGRILDRKDVATIFTTNNATQFTKYSRMQWRLRYEEKV